MQVSFTAAELLAIAQPKQTRGGTSETVRGLAALGTHPGNKERETGHDGAEVGQLGRCRGTHHEAGALAEPGRGD